MEDFAVLRPFQQYFSHIKTISHLFDKLQWLLYQVPMFCFFSCSTHLSMNFFLLISVKIPTIVGILTLMSRGKQHSRLI